MNVSYRDSDMFAPSTIRNQDRINALLSSNDPSTDADLMILRSEIKVVEARIAANRVQLSTIEVFKRTLRAGLERTLIWLKLDELVAQSEMLKGIMSAVRYLPPEVLCRIFEWCLPLLQKRRPSTLARSSLDPRKPPWNLAQVCRTWRQVVQGYPKLWTTVSLVLPLRDEGEDRHQQLVYLLDRQLHFAAGFLLSAQLSTCCYGYNPNTWLGLTQPFFESSPRWRAASLDWLPHESEYPILSRASFPELETLHIWLEWTAATPLRWFMHSPKLVHLTAPFLDSLHLELPNSLTSFTGYYPENTVLHLENIPDLQHCTLDLLDVWRITAAEPGTIVSNLTSLTIMNRPCRDNGNSAILWASLTLPSLKCLEVWGVLSVQGIIEAQKRSKFTLTHLRIVDSPYAPLQLLNALPSLTSLDIHILHRTWLKHPLIERLLNPNLLEGPTAFLPSLKKLILLAATIDLELSASLKDVRPDLEVIQRLEELTQCVEEVVLSSGL